MQKYLSTTVFLLGLIPVCSISADEYQSEVQLRGEKSDVAFLGAPGLSQDNLELHAKYYFSPLDVTAGPYAEAEFLARPQFISVNYADGSWHKEDIDSMDIGVHLRLVSAEGFLFELGLANREYELDSSLDFDRRGFTLGVGKYIAETTSLSLRYDRGRDRVQVQQLLSQSPGLGGLLPESILLNQDGEIGSHQLSIALDSLIRLQAESAVKTSMLVEYIRREDLPDSSSFGGGLTYYFNQRVSLGGGLVFNDSSEDFPSTAEYSMNSSYYPLPTLGFSISYARSVANVDDDSNLQQLDDTESFVFQINGRF